LPPRTSFAETTAELLAIQGDTKARPAVAQAERAKLLARLPPQHRNNNLTASM
jgi:hypothetical protein